MFSLDYAGPESFEVRTHNGGFAGLISGPHGKEGFRKVYFNSNATKGSTRKFATVQAAVEYIRDRRIKKGWGI